MARDTQLWFGRQISGLEKKNTCSVLKELLHQNNSAVIMTIHSSSCQNMKAFFELEKRAETSKKFNDDNLEC